MAVPRPVLIAILGLALCVTALIAVHGVGSGEEDVVPAALPEAPATAQSTPKPAKAKRTDATPAKEERAAKPKDNVKPDASSLNKSGERAAKIVKPKLSAAQVTLAKVSADIAAGDRVVVLFFSKTGAADDTGTRSAVRSIRGMKGVAVYSPNFDDLSDYRPVLAGTGVSQVPSIVIVKPGQKAELFEGYVDAKSLRQQVTDALR
jgi:hypothetical protein